MQSLVQFNPKVDSPFLTSGGHEKQLSLQIGGYAPDFQGTKSLVSGLDWNLRWNFGDHLLKSSRVLKYESGKRALALHSN